MMQYVHEFDPSQSQESNTILTINSANTLNFDHSMDSIVQTPSEYAVQIQNLNKRYGQNGPAIVQDFCMNVRKGTIYGLLGSSGCGKTTILSCIVGLKKWDSGNVLVFGEKPGFKDSKIQCKMIGYMPQDIALCNEMSIREVIQFFGRLYNMTGTEVKERWEILHKLLDLPLKFQLIGNLSGGQKRRASLAVALLHSPKLLVLDEPTVGLDPLLRASIWEHLQNTVKTFGTTIIITTHYIEEARLSNTIGVMRNGRLLVEDSPVNLLNTYRCELLEQVVLHLCKQNESKQAKDSFDAHIRKENAVEFKSTWNDNVHSSVWQANKAVVLEKCLTNLKFEEEEQRQTERKNDNEKNTGTAVSSRLLHALRRIYGLTIVLLLTIMRYPAFLGFLLIMPAFQGAITLLTVGPKPKGLGFAIVNHELVDWVAECDLPAHSGNSCDLSMLSCKYINQLKKDNIFDLKPFTNEQEAVELAHQGQIWGYLSFPEKFTQHSLDHVVANKFALNESLEGSQIHVRLDYSQSIITYFVAKNLVYAYLNYVKQLMDSCDLGGRQVEIPLTFKNPVYGNNEDDFATFVMPGVFLCFLLAVSSTLTGLICITDRKAGTLSRAVAAGLSIGEITISHLLIQGAIAIFQFLIWNAVFYYAFGILNNGPFWLCLLIGIFASLVGTGLGFFLGTWCNDEFEAMVIGIFLCPVFYLLGGAFYPVEYMSKFWQRVGSIIPTTLSTLSLRSVMIRGVGLTHPTVWPGLVVLSTWVVLFPLVSLLTFRKTC